MDAAQVAKISFGKVGYWGDDGSGSGAAATAVDPVPSPGSPRESVYGFNLGPSMPLSTPGSPLTAEAAAVKRLMLSIKGHGALNAFGQYETSFGVLQRFSGREFDERLDNLSLGEACIAARRQGVIEYIGGESMLQPGVDDEVAVVLLE